MDKLNRCPKCNGWVILDRRQFGWHFACLQCGFFHDLSRNEVVIERKNNWTWEILRSPYLLSVS
jgi:hypothetical protein